MLREDNIQEQVAETVPHEATINISTTELSPTGPQSPLSYEPAATIPTISTLRAESQLRTKSYPNMSSKIQIIPNSRQGQLNTTFLATVPGALKIAEVLLGFLSFILAICSDRNATTSAWTEHISFAASLISFGLLLGYVCFPHLTLRDEQTREGLIVVELLFYGLSTLLFFIAIWLMVHLSASWITYGRGSAIIDAILCVALTVIFAIETVLKFRAWKGENASKSTILETAGTTTTTQPRRIYASDLDQPPRVFSGEIREIHRTQGPDAQ